MNGRDAVLSAVRRALGRSPGGPLAPRPEVLPPPTPLARDEEIDRFVRELAALTGVARRIEPGELEAELARLVREQEVRRACLWRSPGLARLDVSGRLARLGVEIVPSDADTRALAACDLGVTEADFALAETGTLALLSSADKPRAVSLLPRIHLAIVDPAVFRADLHQVFAEAKEAHYLVFVTGPSRTADIELTVTLGVHGPRQLHVLLL